MDEERQQEQELYPYPPLDAKMLGNRLRMARKDAGYENADTFAAILREQMGVTQGGNPIQGHTIRAIERGDQDATVQLLVSYMALSSMPLPDWYLAAVRPDIAASLKKKAPDA